MIKAIIFDSDGTLVNTTQLIVDGFKETLYEFGYENHANKETILSNIGGHIPDVFSKIVGFSAGSKIIQDMTLRLDEIQDEIASNTITSYPNERKTLESLKRKKIKLGLFTSGTIYQVKRNFNAVGLDHSSIFDAIVSFEDRLSSKPNPEGLIKCVEKLGVKKNECIYVGDHMVDIEAGRNAKIGKVIGISHGFHNDKELLSASPDKIIHNLSEIIDLV